MTKSSIAIFPDRIFSLKTSINSSAIRFAWKSDLPPAVRVVTKNVRAEKDAADLSDGRDGFDIAGAKALPLSPIACGTTKVVP
jgi:hypothetical protein